MRIGLLTASFLPTIGGGEIVVHSLAQAFTAQGHKVVVIAPKHFRELLFRFKCKYTIIYYPTGRFFKKFDRFIITTYLRLIRTLYKIDILNAHFLYPTACYAIHIRNKLKIPIVVTPHGSEIRKFPNIQYGHLIDKKISKKIIQTLKNADHIVAISPTIKEELVNLGLTTSNISFIPNGVWRSRFGICEKNFRRELGVSINDKVLLAVGANRPVKRYQFLIVSLVQVIHKYKNIKCLIVGKNVEYLNNLVSKNKLNNNVLLILETAFNNKNLEIAFPDDYLISIYNASDIYVSSSEIEGMPLSLLEAMSAGLPSVVTNVPGNKDLVIDNKNGFVVQKDDIDIFANKILTLLEDGKLRKNMSINALKMSKKYDWRNIAGKYLEIFERLLILEEELKQLKKGKYAK